MKAAFLRAPNDVLFADAADPVPEPGDLVLRVRAATIRVTDIRIVSGRKTAGVRYPSVIGHEFAGEFVVAGSFGLTRFQFEKALDLLASRRLDARPFLTHRFVLPAISEALATAAGGEAIKVAIVA